MSFFISSENKIKKSIKKIKDKNCEKGSQQLTCNINDDGINNISHFLTKVIPLCLGAEIKLENIKKGKILEKGSYGYTYGIEDKIIKIIVCHNVDMNTLISNIKIYTDSVNKLYDNINYEEELKIDMCHSIPRDTEAEKKEKIIQNINKECDTKINNYNNKIKEIEDDIRKLTKIRDYYKIINNEIDVYKKITMLDKDNIIMKLLGYFKCNSEKITYNSGVEFKESWNLKKEKENEIFLKLTKPCESYLIIEKGQMDLFTHFFESDGNFELKNFVNLFNIYKFSRYPFFIHNDIKLENIIKHGESYKFIDFGISRFQKDFFEKYDGIVTKYHKLLYSDTSNIQLSPLYDIFCLIYSILDLYYYKQGKELNNISELKTELDSKLEDKIDEKIKILIDFIINIYDLHNSSELNLKNFKYNDIQYTDDVSYFKNIMTALISKLN